jgi:hypothetical protein
MLNEEQQAKAIEGLTGADVVICLQVVSRLVSTGNIQDAELAAVGTARNNLVAALEGSTGVNFDQVRAQQQQQAREAQAARQQAAQEAAQQAAASTDDVADEAPVSDAADEAPEQEAV